MNGEALWKGCDLNTMFWNEDKWNLPNWPSIHPSDNHTVLYHLPIDLTSQAPPHPQKSYSKWDSEHLRMPSDIHSKYPVVKENGETVIETRWEMIQNSLLNPIYTSNDLEKAILSYNSKYEHIWKFTALHTLFQEELEEEESFAFFENVLPKIIQLALQLPDLIPNAIPLLKQQQNKSISMTQQQAACLLANAFLCTFPWRNTRKSTSEYSTYPQINFNRLFCATGQPVLEKLKCICNYFRRVCSKMPTGVITIVRRHYEDKDIPNWEYCDIKISSVPIHVASEGTIETNGSGMLQIDFANRFIGGGVLRRGAVQEEIRFVICPELLVTLVFSEVMTSNEAIFVIGCEQFNDYSGYASSFTFSGNFTDNTPTDNCGRRKTTVCAIDALRFTQRHIQYQEKPMLRELKKAFVGFHHLLKSPAPPVATGNWGCGAFNGSPHLKSLLQLMVCAVVRRPLVYFTFSDTDLCDNIFEFYNFLVDQNMTVNELWKYLRAFGRENAHPDFLFQFIASKKLDASLPVIPKISPQQTTKKLRKSELPVESVTPQTSRSFYGSSKDSPRKSKLNKIQKFFDPALKTKSESTPSFTIISQPSPPHPSNRPSLLDCLDELYDKPSELSGEVIIDISKLYQPFNPISQPSPPPSNRPSLLECLDELCDKPSEPSCEVIIDISYQPEPNAMDVDDLQSLVDDSIDSIIPQTPENICNNKRYSRSRKSKSPVNEITEDCDIIPPTPENKISRLVSTSEPAAAASSSSTKTPTNKQKTLLDFFGKKS